MLSSHASRGRLGRTFLHRGVPYGGFDDRPHYNVPDGKQEQVSRRHPYKFVEARYWVFRNRK